MKDIEKNKINTAVGIAIICLFATIYLAVSYYVIDGELSKYGSEYERIYVMR